MRRHSLSTKIQRVPFYGKLLHECSCCHAVGLKPGVLETRLGDYGMRNYMAGRYEILVLSANGRCLICEAVSR